MILKKVLDTRQSGRTHLFREGTEKTLCERELHDRYRVQNDTEIATCRFCIDKAVTLRNEQRLKRDEQAS